VSQAEQKPLSGDPGAMGSMAVLDGGVGYRHQFPTHSVNPCNQIVILPDPHTMVINRFVEASDPEEPSPSDR